jgi:hypothetical protein
MDNSFIYFRFIFQFPATLLISNCGVFIGVLLSVLSILFFVPELFLFSRVFGAAFANLNFGAFVLFATVR